MGTSIGGTLPGPERPLNGTIAVLSDAAKGTSMLWFQTNKIPIGERPLCDFDCCWDPIVSVALILVARIQRLDSLEEGNRC